MNTLNQMYKMYVRPHLSPYLPVNTLNQMYKMYFDLTFFCDVIFHVHKKLNEFESSILVNNLMDSIGRIQYQVAFAIIGAW